MGVFTRIIIIAVFLAPQISFACEVQSEAKKFTDAFLAGDIARIATFYKAGTLFSIESDNEEGIDKKSATTQAGFRQILGEYLKYQMFRKVPGEIEILEDKIIYGGNNYSSYHFHWSLREIRFKCINHEFKVNHIFLIDGM